MHAHLVMKVRERERKRDLMLYGGLGSRYCRIVVLSVALILSMLIVVVLFSRGGVVSLTANTWQ